MATILVCEDDRNTRLLTKIHLQRSFSVLEAADGREALALISERRVDLIVADVMMPNLDGYALLKTLRDSGNAVPVILLTARQAMSDKREGFSLGTDDYMTKPVNYEELELRVFALLRRSRISTGGSFCVGGITLDAECCAVSAEGRRLELSRKEFGVLYLLLSYPGKIFTKAELLEKIWGNESESSEDTIKTHISRLRSHLDEHGISGIAIEALRGLGYRAKVYEK